MLSWLDSWDFIVLLYYLISVLTKQGNFPLMAGLIEQPASSIEKHFKLVSKTYINVVSMMWCLQ